MLFTRTIYLVVCFDIIIPNRVRSRDREISDLNKKLVVEEDLVGDANNNKQQTRRCMCTSGVAEKVASEGHCRPG